MKATVPLVILESPARIESVVDLPALGRGCVNRCHVSAKGDAPIRPQQHEDTRLWDVKAEARNGFHITL